MHSTVYGNSKSAIANLEPRLASYVMQLHVYISAAGQDIVGSLQ